MNTLDKINTELTALQEELAELHHYTEEIGKAKDSSVAVVKMSQEFLASFQKRVTEINNEMARAAREFEKQCNESASEFENANKVFQQGINQAQNTLSEIGSQLTIAAQNVNDLTVKIESINILGHFERIHASFNNLGNLVKGSQNELAKLINQMENANQLRDKKTTTKQTLLIFLVSINILLVVAMLVKLIK